MARPGGLVVSGEACGSGSDDLLDLTPGLLECHWTSVASETLVGVVVEEDEDGGRG